jgi:hypothetical protein
LYGAVGTKFHLLLAICNLQVLSDIKKAFSSVPALAELHFIGSFFETLASFCYFLLMIRFLKADRVKVLSRKDPIVSRLFRPYIASDFVSSGLDENSKAIPPLISQDELRWLRKTAYLFGIRPEDLNLPEPAVRHEHSPLDRRTIEDLARFEQKRKEKEERVLRRLEKKNETSSNPQAVVTIEEPVMLKPMRFMSKSEREEFEAERLKVIEKNMANMEAKVEKWKEQRRAKRHEAKAQSHKL